MKKYKAIGSWIGIALYVVLISGFVNKKHELTLCNVIEVNIADTLNNRFIKKQEIIEFLDQEKNKIRGYPIGPVNSLDLEEKVKKFSAVKEAEIYKTIDGRLSVDIIQRKPIIRIIDEKGFGFYIDEQGYLLPLVPHYSAHLLVANGNIPVIDRSKLNLHVSQLNGDGKTTSRPFYELWQFAGYVNSNAFWEAQFEQVYRNSSEEYELIPRVGAHIIVLGEMNDFEYKLRKLKALYLKGLNALGWNEYERINLKYSNQVVCTKR